MRTHQAENSPTCQADGAAALECDASSLGLSVPATTFLARGSARWTNQLDRLMMAAIAPARAGRGFASIEVLSPRVTYNDTYPVWEALLHDLDADADHDPTDRAGACAKLAAPAATGPWPSAGSVAWMGDGRNRPCHGRPLRHVAGHPWRHLRRPHEPIPVVMRAP